MRRSVITAVLCSFVMLLVTASCGQPPRPFSALEEGDYERAAMEFARLMEADADNPLAYSGLAETHAAMGEIDKAVEILRQGLENIPDNQIIQAMLHELDPPTSTWEPDHEPEGDRRDNLRNSTLRENFVSSATMAIQDGYIYYLNRARDGKLYSMKTDGSEKRRISEDIYAWISVNGEWLYCISNSGRKLYAMKTDGSDQRTLIDYSTASVISIADRVYFARIINGESLHLYTAKTDGNDVQELGDDLAIYPSVVGDQIYYVNYGDATSPDNLYAMNLDGTGRKKIAIDAVTNYYMADDVLFYADCSTGDVYTMKISGGEREKLVDANVHTDYNHLNIYVTDDRVYYLHDEGGYDENVVTDACDPYLYTVQTDGSEKKKVSECSMKDFCIADGRIYFLNISDDGKLYSMNMDGGDLRIMDHAWPWQ